MFTQFIYTCIKKHNKAGFGGFRTYNLLVLLLDFFFQIRICPYKLTAVNYFRKRNNAFSRKKFSQSNNFFSTTCLSGLNFQSMLNEYTLSSCALSNVQNTQFAQCYSF